MDQLKREYDQFGPWVLEIKNEDDIPQQYKNFTDTIMGGVFSFKVPVNIERCNLKPGMLLYQTVISLTEKAVIILHHSKRTAHRHKIRYDHILHLQYTTDLLFGELIFETVALLSPSLAELIYENDGQVVHHQDGITAIFGAPASHEDDTLRAVETVMEIVNFYNEFDIFPVIEQKGEFASEREHKLLGVYFTVREFLIKKGNKLSLIYRTVVITAIVVTAAYRHQSSQEKAFAAIGIESQNP